MKPSNLPPNFKASTAKLTREDVRARLRLAGHPKAEMTPEDPPGAQLILNVMAIKPYDRNPRQAIYEDFGELKDAIAKQGFQGAIPVTRRPGEKDYMLAQGYNQRLKALQELWKETAERRFRDVRAVYVEWTTESDNQARHLAENLTRSDMTLWDKAAGFRAFKAMRETERGIALSLRELEAEAKKAGLQMSITNLSFYLFAANRLTALRGEIRDDLKYDDVVAIQPRVNRLATITKTFGIEDEAFHAKVLRVACEAANARFVAQGWSAKAFIDSCDGATAEVIGQPAEALPSMLSLSERFTALTKDDLLAAINNPASVPKAKPRAARRDARDHEPAPHSVLPSPTLPSAPAVVPEAVIVAPAGPADVAFGEFHTTTSLPTSVPPPADWRVTVRAQDEAIAGDDLEAAWFHAERLAHAASLSDLLKRAPELPAGFYVEVQPDAEPALDFDEREHRHAGWWMLAAVSGQMHKSVSARLPADSVWRRAHQDTDPDLSLAHVVQERLGMFVHLPPIAGWLVEPGHPLGDAYFDLLTALRRLRQQAPERFVSDQSVTE